MDPRPQTSNALKQSRRKCSLGSRRGCTYGGGQWGNYPSSERTAAGLTDKSSAFPSPAARVFALGLTAAGAVVGGVVWYAVKSYDEVAQHAAKVAMKSTTETGRVAARIVEIPGERLRALSIVWDGHAAESWTASEPQWRFS